MAIVLLHPLVAALAAAGASQSEGEWKAVGPGLEIGVVVVKQSTSVGDGRITVVRIDPAVWELDLIGRSRSGGTSGRTAREWAREHRLAVAINAGMFATDYVTHVGYMECRDHVNSSRINKYQSVAAFDPRDAAKDPPFRIFDLDEPGITVQAIREDYASLVQNLRLIKRRGENRWSRQEKRWSEAALGEDKDGRILFLFSRTPFSMHHFNEELLSSGIGLVAAQHLEGGPEAQLYLKAGDVELEMVGSYETSFKENDGNAKAWPIPNVLGVRRRRQAD